MKYSIDLSDVSEKTFAVISKSDAGDGLMLMVSQRFPFEENFSRIFLNKSQAIALRDFLNSNIN